MSLPCAALGWSKVLVGIPATGRVPRASYNLWTLMEQTSRDSSGDQRLLCRGVCGARGGSCERKGLHEEGAGGRVSGVGAGGPQGLSRDVRNPAAAACNLGSFCFGARPTHKTGWSHDPGAAQRTSPTVLLRGGGGRPAEGAGGQGRQCQEAL